MKKQEFDFVEKEEQTPFQPKQEFQHAEVKPDEEAEYVEGELLEEGFEQAITPKSTFWKTALKFTALLFFAAVVAQSVQWIWEAYQQQQWIYLVFALVSFVFVVFGITEILKEWRRLVKLKKRLQLQQKSQQMIGQSAVDSAAIFSEQEGEQGKAFCLNIADTMKLAKAHPLMTQWQNQLNDSYSAKEVAHLFSQTVLQPFDKKAKKLVTKMAAESAVVVAISPLAVVDVFFVAWRNIRLINQIAAIYGIELGYFTRLRLLRLVLLNIAFAGVTEVVQDVGMDWLSQDLTAKLSARAAQGIGVGLLTARLGIKAIEFCRPMVFEKAEKLTLSQVQTELLSVVKEVVLGKGKIKTKETA